MLDKSDHFCATINGSDLIYSVRFFKMLATDEMRAWYGPEHVCLAADRGAIGTLLISDNLFRQVNRLTALAI